MITLEQVKSWLKIDDDDQDDELEDLITEATAELALAGVPEFDETEAAYPLYRKAIKYIITRDFETRGMDEYDSKILDSMILKLKAMVKRSAV